MSTKSTENCPSGMYSADGSKGPSGPPPQSTKRSEPPSSTSGDSMSTVEGGQTGDAMWRAKSARFHRDRVNALVEQAPDTVLSDDLKGSIGGHFDAMENALSSREQPPGRNDVWSAFQKIAKDSWIHSQRTGCLRLLLVGHAFR